MTRRVFYDVKFVDTGTSLDLISIGLADDQGRMTYAVNADVGVLPVLADPLLAAEVWPALPRTPCPPGHRCMSRGKGHLDVNHPDVRNREQIARIVRGFVLGNGARDVPDVELWSWRGAYQHVTMVQLFGRPRDLPDGFPLFTHDLRQEWGRLGCPSMPPVLTACRTALEDAQHHRDRFTFLSALSCAAPGPR